MFLFARVWSAFHALVTCSLLRTALVSERLGNESTTPHLINQAFLLYPGGLRSPCDGATRLLALRSSTDGQSRLLSLRSIAESYFTKLTCRTSEAGEWSPRPGLFFFSASYLVDPASSHMLVSKICLLYTSPSPRD